MRVIFHKQFYQVYASDPAAEKGRLEAIMEVIEPQVVLIEAVPASEDEIAVVHSTRHIDWVKQQGVFMGCMVREAADKRGAGCFALLEGGYNRDVLGDNTLALIEGLSE